MDNKKKEKLVAIVVTALISLAVSIVACLTGVSPDKLLPATSDFASQYSVSYVLEA